MFRHIKKLVEKDRLPEAIESLQKLSSDPHYENELIACMARYNDLSKHIRGDTLNYEEIIKNKNKLAHSILSLIDEFEKANPTTSRFIDSFHNPRSRKWLSGLALVFIGLIIVWIIFQPKMGLENSGTNLNTEGGNIEVKTEGDFSPAVIGKDVDIRFGGDFSEMEDGEDSLKKENVDSLKEK